MYNTNTANVMYQ